MATGLTGQSEHTKYCKMVISKNKQADADTEATLTHAALFPVSVADWSPINVITDAARATGHLEPTNIKVSGRRLNATLNHPDAPSWLIAILASAALGGTVTKTELATGVYKYSIGLRDKTDRVMDYLTIGTRIGDTITKAVHKGVVISQFGLQQSAESGSFLSVNAAALGTGRRTLEPTYEVVQIAENATSITTVGDIYGSSSAERVTSIQKILMDVTNASTTADVDRQYTAPITFTGSSDKNTIATSAYGAGTTVRNCLVIYTSTATSSGNLGLIDTIEPDLQEQAFTLAQLKYLKFGGAWDGSAYNGGVSFDCDRELFDGFSWTFNANPREISAPGGSAEYIDCIHRGTQSQTVSLGRRMTSWVWQHMSELVRTLSLYAMWEGDLIDSTYKHTVELVFPKLKAPKADQSVSGDYINESMTLTPMDGGTYATVIVNVITDLDGIWGL